VIQRSFDPPIDLAALARVGGLAAGASRSGLIAGEENGLLMAAAEEWLTREDVYNPLLLVGESGTGKSCFAELLVAQYCEEHRDSTVQAISGSDFARTYAEAVTADASNDFHARFARLDLLLLDNLEELRGKDAAQQALRELLDRLLAAGSRVIVVSRVAPRSDRRIMPSLTSRLYGGLVVPVHSPAESTRREILRREAELQQVAFTDEAFDLLAASLTAPPPVLIHAVTQLADENQPIDAETAGRFIEEDFGVRRPTLARITNTVARRFSLKIAELKGKSRRRQLVQARGVAMLLARQLAGVSYQKIGKHFGNRDHSTVMHACRQTEVLILSDDNTRYAYEELSQKLRP